MLIIDSDDEIPSRFRIKINQLNDCGNKQWIRLCCIVEVKPEAHVIGRSITIEIKLTPDTPEWSRIFDCWIWYDYFAECVVVIDQRSVLEIFSLPVRKNLCIYRIINYSIKLLVVIDQDYYWLGTESMYNILYNKQSIENKIGEIHRSIICILNIIIFTLQVDVTFNITYVYLFINYKKANDKQFLCWK